MKWLWLENKLFHLILVILISSAILFPEIGYMSLWDRDEACNSECAREMLVKRSFIVPYLNWELRTDKPPMEYWCMMVSYKIFGVNEFSARFPSVVAGIATAVVTYFLGECILNGAGILAALILILSFHFPIIAKAATPDSLLLFFISFSLYAFIRESEFWGFVFMGLATLTKGPVGFVIPLGVKFFYDLFNKRIYRPKKISVAIFLLIALPWYLAVDLKTHYRFSKGFIMYHNVTRFLKPIGGHKGPAFYYILVIMLAFLPWLWPLYKGLKQCFHRSLEEKENWLFLYCWILFPLVVFSIARTKLPNYIAPVYPAIAVVSASYLKDKPKFFRRVAVVVFCFLFLLQITLTPRLEGLKPSPVFAKEILSKAKGKYTIITYPFFYPSLIWYTKHKVYRIRKLEKLKIFIDRKRGFVFVITRLNKLKGLRASGVKFKILDKRKSLYPNGELVLLEINR